MNQLNVTLSKFKEIFTSLWYLFVLALIIIVLIIVSLIIITKKKAKTNKEKTNNEYVLLFGGKDNIISCTSKGSRLILSLKDYSLINENKLKELGITSYVKATNKITLIIGEKSTTISEIINKDLDNN